MQYSSLHIHTDYSNLRLIDSINTVESVIDYGYKLGLHAVAITDHESLSGHYKALKYFNDKYKDKPYKLILGNEIYLTKEGLNAQTHAAGEHFYHCILLAKDSIGHKQLRELSSRAWDRAYEKYRMMRVPTYISDIVDIIGSNPGHVIMSTACLGGVPACQFLNGEYEKIDRYLSSMSQLFKDDFYIELQPSAQPDQIKYNTYMLQHYNNSYKFIMTTDAHYLTKEDNVIHKSFLQSKEGDENREVDAFYASAYMMSYEQIRGYVKNYITDDILDNMMMNTNEIADKCSSYTLDHGQIVPKIKYEWENRNLNNYNKLKLSIHPSYESLCYYFSDNANESDRYLAALIADGYYSGKITPDEEYLDRLNTELFHIKAISEERQQPLSDYFNTMSKIIDITWTDGDSLVGPGRGSGAGSLINYLLGITQIDPLRQELVMPFWRLAR